MRWWIGSQFRNWSTGVMCSDFLVPVTTLAAVFWILCKGAIWEFIYFYLFYLNIFNQDNLKGKSGADLT